MPHLLKAVGEGHPCPVDTYPVLYIPINDTPFELQVFWPSDIELLIKVTFSKSVSLSLKTRPMMLLRHAARNVKCLNLKYRLKIFI